MAWYWNTFIQVKLQTREVLQAYFLLESTEKHIGTNKLACIWGWLTEHVHDHMNCRPIGLS